MAFIFGTDFSNTLFGTANADFIRGLKGSDNIDGLGGNDTLYGGDDNDSLSDSIGFNQIFGEGGNDTYISKAGGTNTVDLGVGDDLYVLGAGADTLSDSDGYDTLEFTSFVYGDWQLGIWLGSLITNDYWQPTDFEKFVCSDASDVLIMNSDWNMASEFYGHGGNDTLTGANLTDTIYGGDGSDVLRGGGDYDLIRGGDGNDYVDGGNGDDVIYGQVGADTLIGGDGNDEIKGGTENDSILGGSGIDELFGEAGDDTIDGGDGDFDLIFGGTGNDNLSGGNGGDEVLGEDGNDAISGGAGGDFLLGGAGNDSLTGGSNDDALRGDAGIDTAHFNDHTGSFSPVLGWTIDLAAGVATTLYTGSGITLVRTEKDTLISIENIVASAKNDTITGNSVNNVIDGQGGFDTLSFADHFGNSSGGWTIDAIAGQATTRRTLGGPLPVVLTETDKFTAIENITASAGNDTIRAKQGVTASFLTTPANVPVYDGGAGIDTLVLSPTITDPRSLIGTSVANDTVVFSAAGIGKATTATAVRSLLGGGFQPANGHVNFKGIEKLDTGNGNDKVTGSAAVETLLLGAGNDTAIGGAGNDTITGGLGVDSLDGGLGADRFIFNVATEGTDILVNFDAKDVIAIKGSAFGGLAVGALAAAAFRSNTTGLAGDATDRFIFKTTDDTLWYDSNGNLTGGTIVKLADLTNDFAFTAADILIV